MSKIFTPTRTGAIELTNHIVMAPMTRSRAIDNIPNELMRDYYAQRAEAGMLITEGTSPSPNGLGYPRIPGIFNQQQIDGWKVITDAVHERGGKIVLQLMHTGRIGHAGNLPKGAVVMGPSSVPVPLKMYTDAGGEVDMPVAKEMTKEDIKNALEEFVQAAKNAIKAGFDGIEIHGANGYLVEQFLNPHSNIRKDEYGGTVEKRALFLLETVRYVADAVGADRTGIRLSPYGVFNEMHGYDETDVTYDYVSKELNRLGIAYIHLVDHSSMGGAVVPESIVKTIRRNFNQSIILSGGYDLERAERALNNGTADLIAFGRPFLANPDFIKRLSHRFPLNAPKFELFYTPGEAGYTDYPIFEKMKVL